MKLFRKLKAKVEHFFVNPDKCPCVKCIKYRQEENAKKQKQKERKRKVKKSWIDAKAYKDFYCKYIKDGKEIIDKITGVHHIRYYSGKAKKIFILASQKEYTWYMGYPGIGVPEDQVVILGPKVSREIELAYLNRILYLKVTYQARELKMLSRVCERHNEVMQKAKEEMQEVKEKHLSAEEIKKYVRIAMEDPSIGMLSEDMKTREYVTLIYKTIESVKSK